MNYTKEYLYMQRDALHFILLAQRGEDILKSLDCEICFMLTDVGTIILSVRYENCYQFKNNFAVICKAVYGPPKTSGPKTLRQKRVQNGIQSALKTQSVYSSRSLEA